MRAIETYMRKVILAAAALSLWCSSAKRGYSMGTAINDRSQRIIEFEVDGKSFGITFTNIAHTIHSLNATANICTDYHVEVRLVDDPTRPVWRDIPRMMLDRQSGGQALLIQSMKLLTQKSIQI
jgi:hypothetical protein